VRSGQTTPSRPRRRAFALAAGLLVAAGALTACSDDGPPTPAISGENPGEVTVPTVPPTTAELGATTTTAAADDGGATTTTAAP
jgi:hypothetical protein